jgi:hypothetical protein
VCVDYRNLNDASDSQHWPIPDIPSMLRRIGTQKPKIIGKMDLTKGYHQAPISENSRVYTAFMSIFGLYEYVCVPMGPKGAPSYFQAIMCMIVFVGLLYVFLEVYLDDVLIHAQTDDEFISRLRKVFERFRKHKLTASPNKCIFGTSEVEFVGHTINSTGIGMSEFIKQSICDV